MTATEQSKVTVLHPSQPSVAASRSGGSRCSTEVGAARWPTPCRGSLHSAPAGGAGLVGVGVCGGEAAEGSDEGELFVNDGGEAADALADPVGGWEAVGQAHAG